MVPMKIDNLFNVSCSAWLTQAADERGICFIFATKFLRFVPGRELFGAMKNVL